MDGWLWSTSWPESQQLTSVNLEAWIKDCINVNAWCIMDECRWITSHRLNEGVKRRGQIWGTTTGFHDKPFNSHLSQRAIRNHIKGGTCIHQNFGENCVRTLNGYVEGFVMVSSFNGELCVIKS